ncbi:hypothetical protein ABZO31_09775 [Streptomyces sp. HUAS MG47]|uniref:hypothetical protein n=1 Tax=Streptomyces solicamelliae TaxID=3231716 RepID=UPI003877C1F0
MRARRAPAVLSGLLGLFALAGCGIQKSDIVEAGAGAPVTVQPAKGARLMPFFVAADGRLLPVVRDPGLGSEADEYRVATDLALGILLKGPAELERAAGVTTRLTDHERTVVRAGQEVRSGGVRVIWVRLGAQVRDLDPVAVRQLVCTAAYAEEPEGELPVEISGIDGALPLTRCDMD